MPGALQLHDPRLTELEVLYSHAQTSHSLRIKARLKLLTPLQTGLRLPPPLREFRRFGDLPREVRNMVWEFAAHEARTIKWCQNDWSIRDGGSQLKAWNSEISGQRRHPGILHACRESREEGLHYYSVCEEGSRAMDVFNVNGARMANKVFVNYVADNILVAPAQLMRHFTYSNSNFALSNNPLDVQKIQKLCFPILFEDLASRYHHYEFEEYISKLPFASLANAIIEFYFIPGLGPEYSGVGSHDTLEMHLRCRRYEEQYLKHDSSALRTQGLIIDAGTSKQFRYIWKALVEASDLFPCAPSLKQLPPSSEDGGASEGDSSEDDSSEDDSSRVDSSDGEQDSSGSELEDSGDSDESSGSEEDAGGSY